MHGGSLLLLRHQKPRGCDREERREHPFDDQVRPAPVRAIGYMSIPLSSVNGAYYGVNEKVAREIKSFVERAWGTQSIWLLNPAAPEVSLPRGATGADYMLMWI